MLIETAPAVPFDPASGTYQSEKTFTPYGSSEITSWVKGTFSWTAAGNVSITNPSKGYTGTLPSGMTVTESTLETTRGTTGVLVTQYITIKHNFIVKSFTGSSQSVSPKLTVDGNGKVTY